jgi:hypothetical protein
LKPGKYNYQLDLVRPFYLFIDDNVLRDGRKRLGSTPKKGVALLAGERVDVEEKIPVAKVAVTNAWPGSALEYADSRINQLPTKHFYYGFDSSISATRDQVAIWSSERPAVTRVFNGTPYMSISATALGNEGFAVLWYVRLRSPYLGNSDEVYLAYGDDSLKHWRVEPVVIKSTRRIYRPQLSYSEGRFVITFWDEGSDGLYVLRSARSTDGKQWDLSSPFAGTERRFAFDATRWSLHMCAGVRHRAFTLANGRVVVCPQGSPPWVLEGEAFVPSTNLSLITKDGTGIRDGLVLHNLVQQKDNVFAIISQDNTVYLAETTQWPAMTEVYGLQPSILAVGVGGPQERPACASTMIGSEQMTALITDGFQTWPLSAFEQYEQTRPSRGAESLAPGWAGDDFRVLVGAGLQRMQWIKQKLDVAVSPDGTVLRAMIGVYYDTEAFTQKDWRNRLDGTPSVVVGIRP